MSKRTPVRLLSFALLALIVWLLGGGVATQASGPAAPPAQGSDPVALAMAHVRANAATLGVTASDLAELAVSDSYFSEQSNLSLVYLQQQLDSINVYNAIVNVAIDSQRGVIHVGNRAEANVAVRANRGEPTLTAAQAVNAAAQSVGLPAPTGLVEVAREGKGADQATTFNEGGIALNPITARLVWLPTEGAVRLTWNVNIETLDGQHNWSVRVDAATGAALDTSDFVVHDNWGPAPAGNHTHAAAQPQTQTSGEVGPLHGPAANPLVADSYRVYPVPVESPNHASPLPPADGRTLVTDPDNATASPFGWHDTNGAAGPEFTVTRGNNAHAYTDTDANNTPDPGSDPSGGAGPLLTFDFPLDLTQPPSAYRPAAVTNLFYWNNVSHDLNYLYGFNEVAGNFQVNNYGNGGLGNDDVRAEAQDGFSTNNANFNTPADGQRPRMQMFVWTAPTPDRDGDLDAGIILHEYGHGISNRLTGGPSNVSCLQNSEQGGEGWSDWQTLVFTALPSHTSTTNRGVGTYALNQPVNGPGIRAFPYNTDMTVDPRTYQDTRTAAVPHGVGSVWTAILWEGYWALVGQYGFEANFYNSTSTAGNIRMIRLVNEAMKLQPCSPGFVDARNAILTANQQIYGGASQCLLWQAFAKRGLGSNAVQGSSSTNSDNTNGFEIPPECSGGPTFTPTTTPTPSPTPTPPPAGTYCTAVNQSIPDGNPAGINSTITVPDTGVLSDVNVYVKATHTWVGDLIIKVTHGTTTVTAFDRPGVPVSTNGCQGDNLDNSLDDEGTINAETGCTNGVPAYPVGAALIPNNPLSAFDGQDRMGTWTLNISDNAPQDTGTLTSWCVSFQPTGGATATPTTVSTATSTTVPTSTSTTVPTSTSTTVPTSTGTAVPGTATSTVVATSTGTAVPGTLTATPPPTSIELGNFADANNSPLGGWLLSLVGLALIAVGLIVRRR